MKKLFVYYQEERNSTKIKRISVFNDAHESLIVVRKMRIGGIMESWK